MESGFRMEVTRRNLRLVSDQEADGTRGFRMEVTRRNLHLVSDQEADEIGLIDQEDSQ